MPRKWKRCSEDEIESMIAAYRGGASMAKSAATCGASEVALYQHMVQRGIPRRSRVDRTYYRVIDDAKFSEVNDEESAYWLGWMHTDGYVTDRNRIGLKLASVDRSQVVKFARWLGSDREPSTQSNDRGGYGGGSLACFVVRSQPVYDALVRLGCTPNKTHTVNPWRGPAHLMPHYWRGVIEGDGSIYNPAKGAEVYLCGNEAMCKGFSSYVGALFGKFGTFKVFPSPVGNPPLWRISWSGKLLCKAILSHLYAGACVWLDRKKAVADKLIAHTLPGRRATRYSL